MISCFFGPLRALRVKLLLHVFLMKFPYEISCYFGRYENDVLVRFYAFCCTIFERDFLMRTRAFSAITSFAYEISFRWFDVWTVDRWLLKDGRLSVYDVLLVGC
jgi:hypothetical protein